MSTGWFVTGTDTGVGKTLVSRALIACLRERGARVGVYKPTETGCRVGENGALRGDDVEALLAAAQTGQPVESASAALYPDPAAPLVAAEKLGEKLSLERLVDGYRRVAKDYDPVLVEGAGGLLVPIATGITYADLAMQLQLPVICVVGSRLGCINHALLTLEALERRCIPVAGWILNELGSDPQEQLAHATHRSVLERFSEIPCLGTLPHLGEAERQDLRALARHFEAALDLDALDIREGL